MSETFEIIEERRNLKTKGLNNSERQEEYKQLSKIIQTKCRKEKREHINRICSKIKQHANTSHPKDAFKKIKLITDKFKPRSWAIHNTNNKMINDINGVLEIWRKYCEKLYSEENIENTIVSDLDEEPNILLQEVQQLRNWRKISLRVST